MFITGLMSIDEKYYATSYEDWTDFFNNIVEGCIKQGKVKAVVYFQNLNIKSFH